MKDPRTKGLRRTARISGTLMVAFVLVIATLVLIDRAGKQGPGLGTYNIVLFTVLGVGLAGLLVAFWKEGLGGMISTVGFIACNVLAAVNPTPGSSYFFGLLFFFFPSLLYLRCWWLDRNFRQPTYPVSGS